ncbi:MAG: hypothetical protein HY904_20295 [Deltaproteobacteria bacterium]|nr:hypothetical protein [Deltaproteobacteria bacterium]
MSTARVGHRPLPPTPTTTAAAAKTPAAAAAPSAAATPAPAPSEVAQPEPAAPRAADAATAPQNNLALSGNLAATRLQGKLTGPETTPAGRRVEDAMRAARDAGGSDRDAVVAGARADAGSVGVRYDGVSGEDRLEEVFRNTSGQKFSKPQEYDRSGQPVFRWKEKGEKKSVTASWCGVWATDVWKRAGVPAKWVAGRGPAIVGADGKSKPAPSVTIAGAGDPKLKDIKPGDMIVINARNTQPPHEVKPRDTNHHALVTAVEYEAGSPPARLTCPPAAVPAEGRVVGFHTMNGNSPSTPDKDGNNPAIRAGYVDLVNPPTETAGGKNYVKTIGSYYPMPPVTPRPG